MKKKIISTILTLIMLVSLFALISITASAADYYESYTFPNATVGYVTPPSHTFIAKDSYGSFYSYYTPESDSSAFIITLLGWTDTSTGSFSFSVSPRIGLAVGTYKATLVYPFPYYTAYYSFSFTVTGSTYTVTFVDWDWRVLKTQNVNYGSSATPPANPTRTGYTFTGWSGSYTNVTSNRTIMAQYAINTYSVTFVDWDGQVLKTQNVNYGASATTPANPTRTGYTFTGWSGYYTNVTSNSTITAEYARNTYTATFVDWDGRVLKTQNVYYGASASPPANPTRTGYTFTGWSGYYTNVTSNSTITAQYAINTHTVTFEDWDGTVLETQSVSSGGSATPPADPTRTGYTFTGWLGTYENITSDSRVKALYEINEYIKTAVIAVTVPMIGELPDKNAIGTGDFVIGPVSWSPADSPFKSNTVYTATVTLTADSGYTFTGLKAVNVGVNGKKATNLIISGDGKTATLSYVFPSTAAGITPTPIVNAVLRVTDPAAGATPATDATATGNFTINSVTWSPDETFIGGKKYTVTIILAANSGYTFNGLKAANAGINGQKAVVVISSNGDEAALSATFTATA